MSNSLAVNIKYSDGYRYIIIRILSKLSPNVLAMFQMINCLHCDGISHKRVTEDNLEPTRYHLVLFLKVSTNNVTRNN